MEISKQERGEVKTLLDNIHLITPPGLRALDTHRPGSIAEDAAPLSWYPSRASPVGTVEDFFGSSSPFER